MKKYIKLFALIMVIFMATGCNVIGTKVTKCTLDDDQSKSSYKRLVAYNIYSNKDDIVKKVDMEETITSENTTIIAYFEKINNSKFKAENDKYKGITYNVKKADGKVITYVTIDYNKMNLKDYVKANTAMKSYVNKNNKFTLEGAKMLYESLGAKCE